MNKNVLISVVLIIVVGAAAFYGGMMYQKSMRAAAAGQFGGTGGFAGAGEAGGFGRRFGGQGGAAGQNGSAVRGKITSAGNNSITVAMNDGSSKIVLFSGSTSISKAATGSASDLTTGQQVMAVGSNNTDGSVTAQSIQLNPMNMRRGGNPSGTPAAQ